jgi:hypothetical protein
MNKTIKRTKLLDITSGEYVAFSKSNETPGRTYYIEESSIYHMLVINHTNSIDEALDGIIAFHAAITHRNINEFEYIYDQK